MILACARSVAHRLTLYTADCEYPDERAWLDGSTARLIARDQGLRYVQVPFTRPTSEDPEELAARSVARTDRPWATTFRARARRSS